VHANNPARSDASRLSHHHHASGNNSSTLARERLPFVSQSQPSCLLPVGLETARNLRSIASAPHKPFVDHIMSKVAGYLSMEIAIDPYPQ